MKAENFIVTVRYPDGKVEQFYESEPKLVGSFYKGGKVTSCNRLSKTE